MGLGRSNTRSVGSLGTLVHDIQQLTSVDQYLPIPAVWASTRGQEGSNMGELSVRPGARRGLRSASDGNRFHPEDTPNT
eukprot:498694-Pyramimonas_sp.AAC.1